MSQETYYGNAGVTPRVNTYAAAKMLAHAVPVMVLEKTAMTEEMPMNATETVTFRRPRTFTASTTPLVEGVTPSSVAFRTDDVAVSLKQYGMVVTTTDKVEDLGEKIILPAAVTAVGENAGRTQEALDWSVVRGGTNIVYANGSQRTDVNQPMSLTKIRASVRALERQKAMPFRNVISGSTMFATKPIEAAYIAIGHTDLKADIRNLPGFTPVAQYGSRSVICPEEIGSVEDVRFVLSRDLAAFAGGGASSTTMVNTASVADVYPLMIFGQESWGRVRLRGQGSIEPSVIPAGQKTKDDPLGQRGYIGWKMWHAAVRLNEAWMVRLECAATLL
jgi:N4-gp56 family major capsid protein